MQYYSVHRTPLFFSAEQDVEVVCSYKSDDGGARFVKEHGWPSDMFHCCRRRRLEHLASSQTVCERSLPLCLGVVEPPLFNSGSGAVDPRAIALPCVWTSLVLLRLLRGRGLCFGVLASTTWCWAVCPTWLWTTSTSWSGLRLNYNVDDLDTDFLVA